MTDQNNEKTPRLKSLELHGYKTFASRTTFEFPGVVTAIVGPNGSGKSNIADSLRWVLGEQSYSLLRGRKTEDMIFGGSEQRPRASMASATITFDNTDGWLPIDFSEVALARRAYRDGQNEYLLNGQRVRLKEISELLAQSGLAERTYTIIGQGLVDAALSLKPEERRRFFEEAAGIGLYRGRREESLSRLENTRRNLERVQDILAELEPRLQSLEKQARRAIEYERMKADLRVLLRDWYGYHWHKVQKDLAHAREVSRVQEERQVLTRRRLEEVEKGLEGQRQALSIQRNHLNELHAQSAELHRLREKVNRDLAVIIERKHANQDQTQNTQADLARLEEEHNGQKQRGLDLQVELDHLHQELNDAQQQATVARAAYQSRLQEREKIETALRESRRKLTGAETRLVQVRAHRGELVSRKEGLENSLPGLRQGLMREIQSLNDARTRLEEALQQGAAFETNRRQVEEQLSAHRQGLQEAENQRRLTLDARAAMESERSRLKAQLDVLEQADRSFSGLNQGARFLLQASRQGKLAGSYRVLSALLQVPAQFETAIASALGEQLEGILVDGPEQAETALTLLEPGDKGRAVLFTNLSPEHPVNIRLDGDPDSLGTAAQLVQIPPDLADLAQMLLGHYVVVPDRTAARRVIRKIPPEARAVTLRGEIYSPAGMVIAGQEPRTGLIGRPRQKKELQDRLGQTEMQAEEIAHRLSGLDARLAELREKGQALEKQGRQVEQALFAANQAVQKANLAMEQSRQRHDWQQNQIQSLETQVNKVELDIKQQQVESDQLDGQIKVVNDEIRQHLRGLNALPVDDLQAQMAHWTTGVAVAERAVKEAQRRLEEHVRLNQASLQRLEVYRQRLLGLQASTLELGRLETELQGQEGAQNRQIEELQNTIDPVERDLSNKEELYASSQSDQSAAQQAALVADRYATQAQLEYGRVRESLESLRRRIEDDFGLVTMEYNPEVVGQAPLPLDGMVEQLPALSEISPDIDEAINRQRGQLRRMGAINPEAHREYVEVKERFEFMGKQVEDLHKADADLRLVIAELDDLMRREFRKTFDAVAIEFRSMFTRLFGGGTARLTLVDDENPNETGIDIEARLPGRREQGLSLLSGGERSLTAVALIFSLLKVAPTPFCVLDEVDAMLDEANVGRFCDLLQELSEKTQFIVITHNRNTVQAANVIYGVTMGRDSASQVISLKLDEVSEEMVR